MKIFIKTYGCQANINDSEIISSRFKKQGYKLANTENKADTIFINSCSVKNKTQSKILDYIKKHKDKKTIVGGCLVKTLNLKKQFPNISIKIIDTTNLQRLNQPLIRKDKDIAIIQISQGCLNECAYCATKLAKGNLKSYSISKIKAEFERAISEGCKIIYLTSQDNGCYGFDKKTNLANLLNTLTKIKGNYKIRVGMANPQHIKKIKKQLINSMKNKKVQKFLHIAVQSGSDKVLKHMKRGHKVKDFEDLAKEFRKAFPRAKFKDSTIATDIIVGYPSETNKDFQQTINLIKKVKPEVLNISSFSSRPKTQASKLKQLDSKIIKQRTKKLNNLYQEYRKNIPQ